MTTKPTYVHVYDTSEDPEKYVGFFSDEKDAKAWIRKQDHKDVLEIRSEGPSKTAKKRTTDTIDTALDRAIAATKAEEAG